MIYIHARAIQRPSFSGVFVPGRMVPDSGAVYEVHDTDDDPQPAHPLRIGRKVLASMKAKDRLIIVTDAKAENFVDRIDELTDAQRIAQLEAKVEEQRDQIAQLMRHLEDEAAPSKGRRA